MNTFSMYIFLALLALSVGSLLNLIIYRLPLMLENAHKAECRNLLHLSPRPVDKPWNLFFPRSSCPKCKTKLKIIHNLPLVSYLFLKGRCYFCNHPISLRYPLVESLSLALSLIAAWHFGFGLSLIFALLFIWILILLFFIDLEHQILPDCLTLTLLWIGLLANVFSLFTELPNAVISSASAYLFLWLFISLYYLITGKVGMGNGDFKLFAAFGAWFGGAALPYILIMASFSGAVIGLVYLKATNKSKDTAIPFGPFLTISGMVYLFFIA